LWHGWLIAALWKKKDQVDEIHAGYFVVSSSAGLRAE